MPIQKDWLPQLQTTAATDDRVAQLFFTYLMNLDVTNWDMGDIPPTALRRKFKEQKTENNILAFLSDVIINPPKWYNDGAKDQLHWYAKDKIIKEFSDWTAKHNLLKRSWPCYHSLLLAGEIGYSRRIDRHNQLFDNQRKRQVVCYHITKATVRTAHQILLNDVDWDYPEVATSE